jgi:hypothetical protein
VELVCCSSVVVARGQARPALGAQANDVTQLNQRLVGPACLRSIPEVEAPLGDGSHSLPQPHLSSRGNPFTVRYIRQLTMLPHLHMLCIE